MWCVIQVPSNREDFVCKLIARADKDIAQVEGRLPYLTECFVPTCEFERKRRGEWRVLRLPLFPGYVVAVTDEVAKLKQLLYTVPEFTRLLRMGESFTPLSKIECEIIKTYADAKTRTVKMSVGVMEGDHVRVVSGPLRGREGDIKEVNRRGSTALLEVHMFGRTTTVKVGLAIVAKREGQRNSDERESSGGSACA